VWLGLVAFHKKLWEPALLAMAVSQSMEMLAVLAQSLASQLPQGFLVWLGLVAFHKKLWELACQRWRWVRRWRGWLRWPNR
jgi:hypothetical protein